MKKFFSYIWSIAVCSVILLGLLALLSAKAYQQDAYDIRLQRITSFALEVFAIAYFIIALCLYLFANIFTTKVKKFRNKNAAEKVVVIEELRTLTKLFPKKTFVRKMTTLYFTVIFLAIVAVAVMDGYIKTGVFLGLSELIWMVGMFGGRIEAEKARQELNDYDAFNMTNIPPSVKASIEGVTPVRKVAGTDWGDLR